MKIEIRDPKNPGATFTLDELLVSLQIAVAALYERTDGKTAKVKGVSLYLTPLDEAGETVFLYRPKKGGKPVPKSEIKDVISVTPYQGPTAERADLE